MAKILELQIDAYFSTTVYICSILCIQAPPLLGGHWGQGSPKERWLPEKNFVMYKYAFFLLTKTNMYH